MADTIINTPPSGDSGSAGWIVAVIVLIAVVAGGFLWYRYQGGQRPAAPDTTNINVTIPTPGGSNETGGNTTP